MGREGQPHRIGASKFESSNTSTFLFLQAYKMTHPSSQLAGGVAVITGAGGGLGSALARRLGQLQMQVIVADIALHKAQEVASSVVENGGKAEARLVDVSKPDQLDKLADYVHAQFGDVQLLINNAAIETLGLCWEVPLTQWESTLNVNIHGVVHGVRAFLPRMIESEKECWVANVSSIGAFGTIPDQSAYIMTKHAIQAFTEGLYLDVKGIGAPIHVSAVIPGLLRTGIFNNNNNNEETATPARSRVENHRRTMAQIALEHGMDVDKASETIIDQIVKGNFWVQTHPEVATEFISRRVEFLSGFENPKAPNV